MTSPETLGKLSPICGQSVAKLEDGWGCPSNPLFLHSERGDSNPGPLPPQSSAMIISSSYGQLWERVSTFRSSSIHINLRPICGKPK